MFYRIITEDKNRVRIESWVGVFFDGFTVYPAQGYWKGKRENSLIIEIDVSPDDPKRVSMLAYALKYINHQEAVLVQEIPCTKTLI